MQGRFNCQGCFCPHYDNKYIISKGIAIHFELTSSQRQREDTEIQNEKDEGRSKSNGWKLNKSGLKQKNETVILFISWFFSVCSSVSKFCWEQKWCWFEWWDWTKTRKPDQWSKRRYKETVQRNGTKQVKVNQTLTVLVSQRKTVLFFQYIWFVMFLE